MTDHGSTNASAAPLARTAAPLAGRTLATVLAVLCVAALVAAVWVTLWLRGETAEAEQRSEDQVALRQAAERFTETWNTFEAGEAQAYLDTVAPLLSTKFRAEFEKAGANVVTGIEQQQLSSTGKVLADEDEVPLVGDRLPRRRLRPGAGGLRRPARLHRPAGRASLALADQLRQDRRRVARRRIQGGLSVVSNQQPGPASRRRRIAGERRGATLTPGVASRGEPRGRRPRRHVADPAAPGDAEPAPRADAARRDASPCSSDAARRAPSAPGPTAPAAARSRPRRCASPAGRGLVLGLAGLLVVLLLYVGLMLLGLLGTDGCRRPRPRRGRRRRPDERRSPSAERAAEAVLAYDSRTLEEDRDAATRFMTEEYAADYVGTFDTAVVDVATEAKAQVTVEVQGSAVMTAERRTGPGCCCSWTRPP